MILLHTGVGFVGMVSLISGGKKKRFYINFIYFNPLHETYGYRTI